MKDCVYSSQQKDSPPQSVGLRFPPSYLSSFPLQPQKLSNPQIFHFYYDKEENTGITKHSFSTKLTCIIVLLDSHNSCVWN